MLHINVELEAGKTANYGPSACQLHITDNFTLMNRSPTAAPFGSYRTDYFSDYGKFSVVGIMCSSRLRKVFRAKPRKSPKNAPFPS